MPPREYVPLDLMLFEDAKIINAGEPATYLYILLLTKVKALRTDGIVTLRQIQRIAQGNEITDHERRINKLIEAKLLIEMVHPEITETTYQVASWTRWNLTEAEREDVTERKRKQDRERAKNYRERQKQEINLNEISEEKVSKDKRRHVTSRRDESVTISESYPQSVEKPCEHGEPNGANKCALCKLKTPSF